MQHSEHINELATALAKAQGEITGAKKDSENSFFSSKYADLAACWDACREPLSANGLSIVQTHTRGKPVSDIEQGHISTASCILANIAMKLNRTLTWDAERQRVVNDDEANRLLRRPYRGPWVHPEA